MRSAISLAVALVIVTLAVYWQVGSHEFLNLDDDWLITANAHVTTGLTKDNILWALAPVPDAGWFPLTWLSHMADVELYGLDPRGHHLTSVMIHAAATLCLFLLFFRLTKARWQSSFVAALFALHPLHVESVAWVAERRDVLSALFGFIALLMYVEYVKKRRPSFYVLSLLAFVFGLMSKPILVTFPFLMLLLDFWPLNRYSFDKSLPWRRQWFVNISELAALVKEKLLFFLFACACAAITLTTPVMEELNTIPLWLRIANAVTSYPKYIFKMVYPLDLAVYYPFPLSIPLWQVIGSLLILLTITAAVIWAGRRHPYLVVGWLWFLLTLLPVLGLFQFAAHSIADRYTYVSLVGLFIVAAWGVPALTNSLPYRQTILAWLAGVVLITSTLFTWKQISYWQDSVSLFQHTLKVTSGNWLIHYNLGNIFFERGDLDEAIEEYRKAIEINPKSIMVYNNLGNALASKGYIDQAIIIIKKAIDINPENVILNNSLGFYLYQKKLLDEAKERSRKEILFK